MRSSSEDHAPAIMTPRPMAMLAQHHARRLGESGGCRSAAIASKKRNLQAGWDADPQSRGGLWGLAGGFEGAGATA